MYIFILPYMNLIWEPDCPFFQHLHCGNPQQLYALSSKLLLSPLITSMMLPYITPLEGVSTTAHNSFCLLNGMSQSAVLGMSVSESKREEQSPPCGASTELTYTYVHAYIHACIHAYIAYMHTCIHAYMHTCIHAYMHACMHTYIHTYMCICGDYR